MQATVASYDPQTGSGSVLLDTGHEVLFPASAVAGTGLRLLRLGQRVHLDATGSGADLTITRIQLATLP